MEVSIIEKPLFAYLKPNYHDLISIKVTKLNEGIFQLETKLLIKNSYENHSIIPDVITYLVAFGFNSDHCVVITSKNKIKFYLKTFK